MLRLFGATDSTVQYANDYLNYILWGVVLHEFGFSMNSLIRAEGNARIAMISMLISAGINIPLDAFFIIYLDMGVQGAALATIISMACLSLWVLIHFKSKRCVVQLKKKCIGIDLTILGSIVTVGLAPFAMQIANSAVQALLNLSLIKYGSDLAVGAMGIIMSVMVLITMSIVALNMAGQPIIGYNYGARNFSRVRQTLKTSIIFATAIAVVSWILIQSFPGAVISLFVSDSPEIMRYGVEGLRYFLIALPIIGYQIVVGNYFQSVGKAGKAIFVTLLRQVLVLIPLLIVLPRSLGLLGVWIAAPLADTVSGVISALFLVYEWRRLKRQESLIQDAG
jgi:putative MATE family efflux protein